MAHFANFKIARYLTFILLAQFLLIPIYSAPATAASPTITSLSVSSGSFQGGDTVVITGANFTADANTTVTFGGTAAASYASRTTTAITVVTPAKAVGNWDVVVTVTGATPSTTATLVGGFTFNNTLKAPTSFTLTASNTVAAGFTLTAVFSANTSATFTKAELYDSATALVATNNQFVNGGTFTGLKPSETYTVRLTSVGNGLPYLTGGTYASASATTAAVTTLGTTAPLVSGTPTATYFTVTFTSSPAGFASLYRVKLYLASDLSTVIRTTDVTSTSITLTGLTPSTAYKVTVTAIGNANSYLDSVESAFSASISTSSIVAATAPAPTLTLASTTPRSLTFAIAIPTNAVTVRSTLYRSSDSSTVQTIPAASSTVVFTGLETATSYYVISTGITNGTNNLNSLASSPVYGTTSSSDAVIPPPVLTFSSKTANTLTYSISDSVTASAFMVYLMDSATATIINRYPITGTVGGSTTATLTITGLSPQTSYKVNVAATGIGFPESSVSTTDSRTTDAATAPALVLIVAASGSGVTSSGFTTSVTSPSIGATSTTAVTYIYYLYASDSTTVLTTVTTTATFYTFINLMPLTDYYYSIVAVGNGLTNSNSVPSSKIKVTTSALATGSAIKLATPVINTNNFINTSTTVFPTALTISPSSYPTTGTFLSYTITVYSGSDSSTVLSTIPNVQIVGAGSYQVTGLSPATTYYFSLKAIGDGANFTTSDESTKVAGRTSSTLTLANVIPRVSFQADPQSVALTFTAPFGVVSMTARLYDSSGSLLTVIPSYISTTSITGLLPSTNYKVTLQSIGNGSTYLSSAESTQISFTTSPAIKLQPPLILSTTVTVTPISMTLSFTAPTGASSCRLSIYAANGSTLLFQLASFANGGTVTGLQPSTTYKISIKCFGNGGGYLDSDESPQLTVSTPASTTLLAPAISSIAPTAQAVTINYTTPTGFSVTSSANFISYQIKLWNADGGTLLATISTTNTTNLTIPGLDTNTAYRISIKSIGNGVTTFDSLESDKYPFTTSPLVLTTQAPAPQLSAVTGTTATITIAQPLAGFSLLRLYASDSSTVLTTISTAAAATSVPVTNLNPNTTYWVSLVALGNGGGFTTSSESQKITFTTIQGIKLVSPFPTAFVATPTSVTLTVPTPATNTSYTGKLYAADGTTLLGVYPQYLTATVIDGLLPSTSYVFTVTSIGDGRIYLTGSESKGFAIRTSAPITLLPPTVASVATSPISATLTLTAPTVAAVTSTVRIYNPSTLKLIATIPSYTSGTVITSPFLPGTKYSVTVQSVGNGISTLNSDESAPVAISTPSAITLMAPRANTATTTTPNSITLSLLAPNLTGSLGIQINLYNSDGSTLISSNSSNSYNATSPIISNLQPSTTYQVGLIALGDGYAYLNSPESVRITARTAAPTTLAPPTGIIPISLSGNTVSLTFSSIIGVNSYTVKTYSADGSTLLATQSATSGTFALVSGLTPSTTYQFTVTAVGNGSSYLTSIESAKVSTTTLAFSTALPTVPNQAWTKSEGGTSTELSYATLVDAGNNVYTTGYFSRQATFGTGADSVQLNSVGGSDIFLAKYSSNGTLLWAKQAGGTGADIAFSLAFDPSGNILVAGYFSGVATFGTESNKQSLTSQGAYDGFIAKYTSDGGFTWVRQAAGTGQELYYGVSVDSSGNIYAGGSFSVDLIVGTGAAKTNLKTFGSTDGFLAKYASNGTLTWVKQFGGPGGDYLKGVAVDKNGNIFITGPAASNAVFGSGVNSQPFLSQAGIDIFVAKYSSAGELLWLQSAGGSGADYGQSIATDLNGNVFIGGYIGASSTFGSGSDAVAVNVALTYLQAATTDGVIAKYSNSGRLLWVRTVAGQSTDVIHTVAVDTVGNVYAGGYFNANATITGGDQTQNLYSYGAQDALLIKYANNGTLIWARGAGGAGSDYLYGISTNASDALAVSGYYNYAQPPIGQGAIFSFGSAGSILESQGLQDTFVSLLQTSSNASSTTLIAPTPVISEIKSTAANIFFFTQNGSSSHTVKLYDSTGNNLINTYTNFIPGKQITGLSSNTAYRVSVQAIGDGASTSSSSEGTKQSFTTALNSTTPVVFNIGADQALVSFSALDGAASYLIQIYDASGANKLFTVYSSTPKSTSITNLLPNTTYKVAIKPNADGFSNLSFSEGSLTTFTTAAITTLAAPVATQSASTATQITINIPSVLISPQMVTGTRGYILKIYQSDGTTLVGVLSTTATTITVDGLNPASTYKVSVTAVGDGVQYLTSAEGVRTLVSTAQSSVAAAPAPIITGITSNNFTVTFAPIPSLVSSAYVLRVNSFAYIGVTSGSSFSTGVLNNTNISVTMQSIGDGVNLFTSPISTPVTFTSIADTSTALAAPLPTITAVTATALTIMATPVIGATNYIANFYDTLGSTLLFATPVTIAGQSVTNLLAGTNYKIELIAVGNGVFLTNSNPSSKISVTTLSSPTLPAPTNIQATLVRATSFAPTFTAVPNAYGYKLKLYRSDGTTLLATVPNVVTSGTTIVVNLATASSFKYTITALGDGVKFTDSPASAMQSVDLPTVQKLNPPSFNIASTTSNGILVSYTATNAANTSAVVARIYASDATTLISTISPYTTGTTINSGLAPSTSYYLSLQALGDTTSYLNSDESAKIAFTTAGVRKLLAPVPLIASVSPRSVYVTFPNTQLGQVTVVGKVYSSSGTLLFTVPAMTSVSVTTGTTINGLQPATSYQIALIALGDQVNYTNSDTSTAVTFTTAATQKLVTPAPSISFNSATSFKVNFPQINGALSYFVNVYQTDGTTLVRSVPLISGSAIFGFTPGTDYKVALVAVGDGLAYLTSDESTKTAFTFTATSGSAIALTSPTPTISSITTNTARVNYVSTSGTTSYTLKLYAADGTTLISTFANFTATSNISNLVPATTYKVSITAIGDGVSFSTASEGTKTAFITAALPVPDVAPTLATPTVSVTPSSNAVVVTFASITGASSYVAKVYAADGTSTVVTSSGFTSGGSISGLTPSTNYSVAVTAIGDGSTYLSSAESTKATFTTSVPASISAPTPTQIGQTNSTLRVSFTAISAAVGYVLKLYAADGTTLISTFSGFSSGDTISDLTSNTTYKISVTSLGDGVNNANSAEGGLVSMKTAFVAPVATVASIRPVSFAVTFPSVSGASSYTLKIYAANGTTLISTTNSYSSGTVITGMSPSTTYKVALISKGNGSTTFDSPEGALVSAVTPAPITLSSPISSISAVTTTSASVSFADVSDALSYTAKVYAADGTTLLNTITSFTSGTAITGLTPSTTYKISVTAIGDGASILTSIEGNQASVLTIDQVTLSAPAPTVASQNSSSGTITFTAASGSSSTTAKLYAADGTTLLRTLLSFTSGTTISGLTSGTTYKLTTTAVGDGVNYITSSESTPVSIVTTAVITLTAPVGTAGTITTTSFKVNFTPVANASSHAVKIYASDGTTLLRSIAPYVSGTAITGLTPATGYVFKTTAIGNGSTYLTSADSSGVSVTTSSLTTLSAPVPTISARTPTTLTVAFTAAAGASSTRARIYTGDGATLITIIGPFTTGMQFSGLTPDTDYQITLESVGDGLTTLTSSESSQVLAHTAQPIVLTAPTPVIASVTSSTFRLTFSASEGALSYIANIYASDGSTLISSYSDVLPAGKTISGLTGLTTYKVSLQAVGDGATFLNSSESSFQSLTTLQGVVNLSAPNPTVDSVGSSSASISFGAVSGSTSYTAKIYAENKTTLLQTITSFTSGGVITGLSIDTNYAISLTTIGDGVYWITSGEGSKVSFKTAAPLTLTAPSGTFGTATANSASVTFASVDSALDYAVKVYAADGTTLLFTDTSYSSGTPITGLSPSTSYVFTLASIGDGVAILSSSYSGAITGSTTALPQLVASSPTVFSSSQTSVKLIFSPVTGAVSYTLKLYQSDGTTLVRTTTGFTSGSSVSSLTANTSYKAALIAAGDDTTNTTSAQSDQLSFTTLAIQQLAAPTFFISAQNPRSISVSFAPITGAVSYTANIYDSAGTTLITTVTGFTSGGTFTGLSVNTGYQIAIQTIGDGTNYTSSALSDKTSTSTTPIPTLLTPDAIAVATGTTTASATFSAQSGATQFNLKVYEADGTTLKKTVNNYVSGATVTGLDPSTTYQITVIAIGDGVSYATSDTSSFDEIKTASPTILGTPTASVGSVNKTSAVASFGSVTNASSYTLKLYSSGGSLLQTSTSFSTGGSITGLSAGTSYSVGITAIGDTTNYLNSAESSRVSFTTTAAPVLDAPGISISSKTQTGFTFTLGTVANASSLNAKLYALDGTTVLSSWTGLTSSQAVTGLTKNTKYFLTSRSIGSSDYASSGESAQLEVITLDLDALTSPSPTLASRTQTSLRITFPSIANAQSYTAKVRSGDGLTLLQTLTNFTSGTAISTLTLDTTYLIEVIAIGDAISYRDSIGNFSLSAATEGLPVLNTPSVTVASKTKDSATFTFASITGALSYTLKLLNGFSSILRTVTNYVSGAAVDALDAATTYAVQIFAVADGTTSSNSTDSPVLAFTTEGTPSPTPSATRQADAGIVSGSNYRVPVPVATPSPTPTPEPEVIATPTPEATPEPEVTTTPEPVAPTVQPTPETTPTASPTPTPTPTLIAKPSVVTAFPPVTTSKLTMGDFKAMSKVVSLVKVKKYTQVIIYQPRRASSTVNSKVSAIKARLVSTLPKKGVSVVVKTLSSLKSGTISITTKA